MNSNIHGINEFRDNNFIPVRIEDSDNDNKESCCDYFCNIFCPFFNIRTCTFILAIIEICFFIITLMIGYDSGFLEINANTLDKFGMKIPYKIYYGQIHRLFLYGFLHKNFLHIFFNLLSQMFIGFILEKYIGHLNFIIIFLYSSPISGIFSCIISNSPSVGASASICSLMGAYLGFIIINYGVLDSIMGRRNKYCQLILMIILIIQMVITGFANEGVDNYGHLGGLFIGFFGAEAIFKPIEINRGLWFKSKTWKYIGFIAVISFSFFSILGFWLGKKY